MYDTASDVVTPLDAAGVTRGTNVLIAGPAMTGKRRLLFDILGGSRDRAGILITTKRSGAQLQGEFGSRYDLADWRIMIVDCVSRQRSVGAVRDSETVRYVNSPRDLTGIGIETSGFMQDLYHDETVEDARVGFHSLSTILMFASLRQVYQFVHVVTGRIESSGFVGAFTIDSSTRSDESITRLAGLFDAMVEVRDDGDEPELRVRGGQFGPRRWTTF